MKVTKDEVLEKISVAYNKSKISQELDWFKRHPLQTLLWVFAVAAFIYVYLWLNKKPPAIQLAGGEYKQISVERKPLFKKNAYPISDEQIDMVVEDGMGSYIIPRDRGYIIVPNKSDAKAVNYVSKWGFCATPKLVGIVNSSGPDSGLGLKVFYVNDFGVNLIATTQGAGLGLSFKPLKKFRNTSIEFGVQKTYEDPVDGKAVSPFAGIGVEF